MHVLWRAIDAVDEDADARRLRDLGRVAGPRFVRAPPGLLLRWMTWLMRLRMPLRMPLRM
jgi:hypothetical protein